MGKRGNFLSEANSDPVTSLHNTAASTWEDVEKD